MKQTVAFVGVGRMGSNMARRLADQGFAITAVHDARQPAAASLASELACAAPTTLAAVTGAADVIVTVISDDDAQRAIFAADGDSWRHEPERGEVRRLVCRSGNPFGLPAKDRSGRLDVTETPDLGALLTKINANPKG